MERSDVERINCGACREELSARLDDEADPQMHAAVEAHVESCAACRDWERHAASVTRRTRTTVVDPAPDLVARVLPAAPTSTARWRRVGPRVGLAVVGAVQLLLGGVALLGGSAAMRGMADGSMLGAGMAHMNHETAAWNLALGAAFVAGAWWRRHLAGLLPALGVFVAVLAVVSTIDLTAGRVQPDRVASHLVLLVGFVLAVLVARSASGDGTGPAPRVRRSSRVLDQPDQVEPGPSVTFGTGERQHDGLGPVAHEHRRDTA